MVLIKLFPRVLIAGLALAILPSSTFAQTSEASCSPDDSAAVSAAVIPDAKPVWVEKSKPTIDVAPSIGVPGSAFLKFEPLLMTAIDQRLGSPYRWGATGPNRFDCSGFVWSIYQASGINFERESARGLFAHLAPAPEGQEYTFGTLVFFSGLTHVGVVADEHGFYHASRHHGVVYQEFNEYWLKRIDGFRRVPLPVQVAKNEATDSRK
jgi:cell wall-associated NlpC family hydrolase